MKNKNDRTHTNKQKQNTFQCNFFEVAKSLEMSYKSQECQKEKTNKQTITQNKTKEKSSPHTPTPTRIHTHTPPHTHAQFFKKINEKKKSAFTVVLFCV